MIFYVGRDIMEWTILYLTAVNLAAFLLFAADKKRAKEKKRRISEKTLFAISLLGGSLGGLLAMQIFRHKTKHLSFLVGIPACLIANAAALWLIFSYMG